jgi:HSP20 family protein
MLARWDPHQEMTPLREMMNRLFEQSIVPSLGWGSQLATQAMDVYTEGDSYVIELGLPGFNPDAVDVSCEGNQLTIRGEQPPETQEQQNRRYLLRERMTSRFERTITLPSEVAVDQAQAHYEQGLLRLVFPKAEHAKPRRISLTGGSRSNNLLREQDEAARR